MYDTETLNQFLEGGKGNMRGRINTVGVEEAARIVADAYTAPGNDFDHQALQGIILAAFEAGMLHQMNRSA